MMSSLLEITVILSGMVITEEKFQKKSLDTKRKETKGKPDCKFLYGDF